MCLRGEIRASAQGNARTDSAGSGSKGFSVGFRVGFRGQGAACLPLARLALDLYDILQRNGAAAFGSQQQRLLAVLSLQSRLLQ
jgi:hypothetical protein